MSEEKKVLEVLEILKEHKEHITSVRNWEHYAKEHSLPSSSSLIKIFGSWNNLKLMLGISANKKYSKKELLDIANKHSEHFTTYSNWNEYASKHGLPVSTTFLIHFDSWNDVKKRLNLPLSTPNWRKYSKEEIKKVIEEHSEHFTSKLKWDEYSKENKLPDYRTIKNYFSWEEVQEFANVKINYRYSEEKLLEIAKKHSKHFTTMKRWDEYAKENNLPSSMNYYRKFGSWNKVKAKLFM
ncbi:hypothetical protein [Alkalihalobacillus sp. BA299]|uniref:hypothetical protein n=1 Tax=Alkalihalobacillus sp. BA299 TaxID=2815938 RepID=UPI001ADD4408|nr:hypothetical protein [Alkalihalobacillus sp. BA299]